MVEVMLRIVALMSSSNFLLLYCITWDLVRKQMAHSNLLTEVSFIDGLLEKE